MGTQAVRRIYVEKKPGGDIEARSLRADLAENLGLKSLTGVRVINRYDISGLSEDEYTQARFIVFGEPALDLVYDEEFAAAQADFVFAMEYLPGQYDQRADSAAQCLQILSQKERPKVASAKVIVLQGELSAEDFRRVKAYCINPIEAR